MAKVQIGVNAFTIPASELEIFCCAKGYRKAGKKDPISPTKKIVPKYLRGIIRMAFNKKGLNAIAEKNIRRLAT